MKYTWGMFQAYRMKPLPLAGLRRKVVKDFDDKDHRNIISMNIMIDNK
jgi:hypothetical protein